MKIYNLIIIMVLLFGQNTYAQKSISAERAEFAEIMKSTKNFTKDYLLFEASDHNNSTLSSDSLKGSNVFYVFGDSKCSPCLGLAKTIASKINQKKYENQNIKFAFITYDDKKGMDRLINIHKLNFDYIISMSMEQMKQVGLYDIVKPTYILVNKNGKVMFKGVGFSHDLKKAEKEFEDRIAPEIEKLIKE